MGLQSQTRLSDFHFLLLNPAAMKCMNFPKQEEHSSLKCLAVPWIGSTAFFRSEVNVHRRRLQVAGSMCDLWPFTWYSLTLWGGSALFRVLRPHLGSRRSLQIGFRRPGFMPVTSWAVTQLLKGSLFSSLKANGGRFLLGAQWPRLSLSRDGYYFSFTIIILE